MGTTKVELEDTELFLLFFYTESMLTILKFPSEI